jgi:hypothetical protein
MEPSHLRESRRVYQPPVQPSQSRPRQLVDCKTRLYMVVTNQLLTIAFSIVTNFTSLVEVPTDCVPRTLADIKHYGIGSPSSPIDIGLTQTNGGHFGVCDGVVSYFDSERSVFHEQDPGKLWKYSGTAILTTNEALLLASNTLQRLIVTNHAARGLAATRGAPKVHQAGIYEGQHLPFFKIEWPSITEGPYGANIEIDGRTAKVVHLVLFDDVFRDYALDAKIRRQVYTPESVPKLGNEDLLSPIKRFHLPQPSTNTAHQAIGAWLQFCYKLGCTPGSQTNVSDINWDLTWLYTNKQISASAPICQIRFKNGACFESINGITISHYPEDACFAGDWDRRPAENWARFRGEVTKDWTALAKRLELRLADKLQIPPNLLALCRAWPRFQPPEVGTRAYKCLVVDWRELPSHPLPIKAKETRLAFAAEFDLQTGDLKWISFGFEDANFAEALLRAR